jgi:hypothetical protein
MKGGDKVWRSRIRILKLLLRDLTIIRRLLRTTARSSKP